MLKIINLSYWHQVGAELLLANHKWLFHFMC